MPKGESSYFGFARESSYSQEVTSSKFWKVLSCSMDWGREMQRRFRIGGSSQSSEVLQRAWNQTGNIKMEADPDATCELLYALFGEQTITPIPERPAGGTQTTLSGLASSGDSTIDVVDATGLIVGDWLVIDTGVTCEFVKITAIAGSTLSIEAEGTDDGLLFDHDTGDAVEENTTPAYKHVFEQTNDLPSYTWELDLGTPEGNSTARFAGMTARSMNLDYQAMEPVMTTTQFIGSKMSIHNTNSTPTYENLGALFTRDTTVEFGTTDKTGIIKNLKMDITNGLEGAERTIESGIFATKGSPGGVSANFSAEAIFDSDIDLQRFLGSSGSEYDVKQTTIPFSATITTNGDTIGNSETNNYSLKLIMPNVYMTKCSVPVEIGRRIAQSWNAMAVYDDSEEYALRIELVNGTY